MERKTYNAYVFYFDIVDVVEDFIKSPDVLERLAEFQRSVRQYPLGIGQMWSTVITLADNVWARINSNELIADQVILKLATRTMVLAYEHGFKKYYGVCTSGPHIYYDIDKSISLGLDPTHLLSQHIDTTSEPQIRAAISEKWSAKLSKEKRLPCDSPCVWVSEEVANYEKLRVASKACEFNIIGGTFNLNDLPIDSGRKKWPFPNNSKFTAIVPNDAS